MDSNIVRLNHWENVYANKPFEQVSWFEKTPALSVELVAMTGLPKTASILDVGGGDALLAEHLVQEGYQDVSVLDISQRAIDRAQLRMGEAAGQVKWLTADLNGYAAERTYDLWHDRAVLHFFRAAEEQLAYRAALLSAQPSYCIIGAFKIGGPTKCSGIEIMQYDEASLAAFLAPEYRPVCFKDYKHMTPSGAEQMFVFGVFERV